MVPLMITERPEPSPRVISPPGRLASPRWLWSSTMPARRHDFCRSDADLPPPRHRARPAMSISLLPPLGFIIYHTNMKRCPACPVGRYSKPTDPDLRALSAGRRPSPRHPPSRLERIHRPWTVTLTRGPPHRTCLDRRPTLQHELIFASVLAVAMTRRPLLGALPGLPSSWSKRCLGEPPTLAFPAALIK